MRPSDPRILITNPAERVNQSIAERDHFRALPHTPPRGLGKQPPRWGLGRRAPFQYPMNAF